MKLLHLGLCVQPPPINGFQKAFIDVLGYDKYREVSSGNPNLNFQSIRIFNEFNPDVVFMQIQAPNIISKQTVQYFHSKGAKVINWTGDVRDKVPSWMLDIAPYCITSFSNMTDVIATKARGYKSEYLEIGYDPEIYKPDGDSIIVPEILFMANNYGANYFPLSSYRLNIATQLQIEFGDRFGVYGNGWNYGRGNVNHSQPEEAKHYRGAKIAINCSHFNYERYSSDRLLRILGTGTFCLSHKYLGIENDYTAGFHLDIFNDINELKEKINYYLIHEEERLSISKSGNELVLNRNTFKHQVENIIKL